MVETYPKIYDIKTLSKVISTAVATLGIGQVPVGMKRYVTMLRANNNAGANNVLYICSATNSAAVTTLASASAAQKFSVLLAANETADFPKNADITNPLFSIAASQYVNARTSTGTVRLFMQYYDY